MLSKIAKNDALASKNINIAGHYDNDTLIDKSGRLIKIFKLAGVDFATKGEASLDTLKHRRNMLLKSFNSRYALYFWIVRKKSADYPGGEFLNPFAHAVNKKYRRRIKQSDMYHNALYIALVAKPPEGLINKGVYFLQTLSKKIDKRAQQSYLVEQHKEFCDVARHLFNALSVYQPKILGVYAKEGRYFSQPLSFLSEIINVDKAAIPLLKKDASIYLPRKRLFFNSRAGIIEMRSANGHVTFGAALSIKDYPAISYQGMLDELNSLKMAYALTQSFRFYERHHTKIKLRQQQKELFQSEEESLSQTEEISKVFDSVASGDVEYGEHHFTLICYADSKNDLNKNISEIMSRFSNADIHCVREDLVSECSFWSQLPGNFAYIARQAKISTRNLAGLASLHNDAQGKISGNYWGEAVTVFETLSGSPYYFNFHYKDVGNFLIFGAMGSGKTVLAGFLITQSLKFGGKRVIFDKDRGLHMLVCALGGVYEILKPGIATGFNPCALENTPENRKFLATLFKKILTVHHQSFDESDAQTINKVIDGLYALPSGHKQFKHLAPYFGLKKKGSLRQRFEEWHSQGNKAWLFDNEKDSLSLNTDVMGFDIGKILEDEEAKTPALMYLTYRIQRAMQNHRSMMFFDEGWKALSDEYFKNLINDESRTPRKKNNFLGLATQDAEDTVNHAISKTINTSSACKIFFPNPSASEKIYIKNFGLSEHEFHLIKTLPDNKNYFLLNYGHGVESVVIRANLEGLEDEIAIISGRETTLKLFDEARAQVGNLPQDWLPVFHKKRHKMAAA